MRLRTAFMRRATEQDAPYFRTVPCPTCRAQVNEYCTRASRACLTRIETALFTTNSGERT